MLYLCREVSGSGDETSIRDGFISIASVRKSVPQSLHVDSIESLTLRQLA